MRVDYKKYIMSDEWAIRLAVAKDMAGHRCQFCNSDDSMFALQGHHRTYARLGNEAHGDITVLCQRCHSKFHDKPEPPPRVKFIKDCVDMLVWGAFSSNEFIDIFGAPTGSSWRGREIEINEHLRIELDIPKPDWGAKAAGIVFYVHILPDESLLDKANCVKSAINELRRELPSSVLVRSQIRCSGQ